jgi:hypothetical protein
MKLLIVVALVFGWLAVSNADETMTEKAQATSKTATRAAKKGLHRAEEAICGKLTGDSKLQCLAKEAKNNLKEGADVVADKATEVKNKIDTK